MKITVFNCSAFKGGATQKISYEVVEEINKAHVLYGNVNLVDVLQFFDPENIMLRTDEVNQIFEVNFAEADKIIFIVPEYNASFPGVLKLFLDVIDHTRWENKKVCIIGVSGGRGGNLRGMEHLTTILNYLKMNVFYNKLPLSNTKGLFDVNGELIIETKKQIKEQIEEFLNF